MDDMDLTSNTVDLATELTIAWLANPNTRATAEEVPAFLQAMHNAVSALTQSASTGDDAPTATPEYEPAVSVRKSLASRDFLISLIDGKPYKTLRRHLTGHGLTPDEYRARYNLKSDYPMVATTYSEARREMAKKIGLGRKPGTKMKPADAPSGEPAAPKRRGRPPKTV